MDAAQWGKIPKSWSKYKNVIQTGRNFAHGMLIMILNFKSPPPLKKWQTKN